MGLQAKVPSMLPRSHIGSLLEMGWSRRNDLNLQDVSKLLLLYLLMQRELEMVWANRLPEPKHRHWLGLRICMLGDPLIAQSPNIHAHLMYVQ